MAKRPTKSGNRDASGICRVPVAIPCRGAPRRNANAVRHGAFGAPGRARRAEIAALIAEANEAIAMIEAVAAARRAGQPDPVFELPPNQPIDAPVTSRTAAPPPSQKSTVYSVTSRKSH